jgi:hypothetical protein
MLKTKLTVLSTIFFLIFWSCSNKHTSYIFQQDCDVIHMVYDTFMEIHKNEFKHMKLERFYICNFDFIQTEPYISMYDKPKFIPSDTVSFNKNELLKIGNFCLNHPDIIYIDQKSANDTILQSNTTNKVIWGITNFQKNEKYVYLIFGSHFGRSAIIADEYLLELTKGKYKIINIYPVSH